MLAVWTALAALIGTSGGSTGELAVGLHMITVPLWFLSVYLVIVLLAPTVMRLHRRFGLWPVVGTLAVAAAGTDALSIGAGLHLVGYANLIFVWVAVHFLVGTALVLRPAGTALARRPAAWLVIALGNSAIMTIFCWHLTACYLVQAVLLVAGVRLPAVGTPTWYPALAGWLLACTAVCAALVLLFRRVERSVAPATVRTPVAVGAVLAAATGLFAVSATGLDTLSLRHPLTALPAAAAVGLVALGVHLLRSRPTRS